MVSLSPHFNRGDWSPEEDMILIRKQQDFGNAWSKVREFLPRRSCGSIKNRWNWLSRRDLPRQTKEMEAMTQAPVRRGSVEKNDFWREVNLGVWSDSELKRLWTLD
jgi:hypothetical protein